MDDAALPQQIVRQKKLRIIGNALEHLRQDRGQGVALGDKEILEQLLVLVGVFQLIDFIHVQAVQIEMDGLGENLRLELASIVGKYPHMGGQIAVDLHEAEGSKTVEPGIGDFFYYLLISMLVYLADERSALLLLGIGQKPSAHAVRVGVGFAVRRDSIL